MHFKSCPQLLFLILILFWQMPVTHAQPATIYGMVRDETGRPIAGASLQLERQGPATFSDSLGGYHLEIDGRGAQLLRVTALGRESLYKPLHLHTGDSLQLDLVLRPFEQQLETVVVSGTLKEVSRRSSPVPVEVYTAAFFKANPAATVFEALQQVNGIRPQLNCNICNAGDIHINGMEGAYTMVLIDGMPLVSGLSTVYGLSGIPQSLIERIEIIKGPASTLYGTEAVGGLINIITKKPEPGQTISGEGFITGSGAFNQDLAIGLRAGEKADGLLGINYFNYQQPIDRNGDHFTDMTLQHRISIFNKWRLLRKDNRHFSMAARYVYEDRWGGEMNWKKVNRAGRDIYGESIYTNRLELFGNYTLPFKEPVQLQFSGADHRQNAAYGDQLFLARQSIAFGQLHWSRTLRRHELLSGISYRFTYYDDNTPATRDAFDSSQNLPDRTGLPGIFLQDEFSWNENNTLLMGIRLDYQRRHGSILSPRLNYRWKNPGRPLTVRFSLGNGYRVAQVFTEDHAALTGARALVFKSALQPETSWNASININNRFQTGSHRLELDFSAFYTYFTNKIIADYDSHPDQIIYDNLRGYAISRGLSLNAEWQLPPRFSLRAGATAMDLYRMENGQKIRQLFSENVSAAWNISYRFPASGLQLDYTGNLYSPMRLPLLSERDPRKPRSPWWVLQNVQCSWRLNRQWELFGGIKNLSNWTPARKQPFLIARAEDPFDKNVALDAQGYPLVTPLNPYGLSFDPSYVYAPQEGRRAYLGVRFQCRRR